MFLVLARDENDGIGRFGRIPWTCTADMDTFRAITSHTNHPNKTNLVIAGHTTRQNMPPTLRDRTLVTLNRDGSYETPDASCDTDQRFLIGGKKAIETYLATGNTFTCLILTRIHGVYGCDVCVSDSDLALDTYRVYAKKRIDGATVYVYVPTLPINDQQPIVPSGLVDAGLVPDETQYLDLVREILTTGERRDGERTGTGTLSVFGRRLSFDLADTFPLITTKRVFFRGVIEELAWFLNADTDSKTLEQRRVNIWSGNTTREFLASRSLPYRPGIAGPIYGAQWRHWGGTYDPSTGTSSGGTDQIRNVITSLRTAPESRRHIVSVWNVDALDEMALPPCHVLIQFYATTPGRDGKRRLKCQMYQRSCDVALGLPFNIASYALLTHLIADACEMVADELIITLGDCHIYQTHVASMQCQLARTPFPPPTLELVPPEIPPTSDPLASIDRFLDDPVGRVMLWMYTNHGPIQMEMVA